MAVQTREPVLEAFPGGGALVGSAAPAPASRGRCLELIRLAVPVLLLTVLVGSLVRIGADARWLAALGGVIAAHGSVPAGVPFAGAGTAHWANTLVFAELIFHWLEALLGDRGLALAQLVAVAGGLTCVAVDARAAGARTLRISETLLVLTIGALPSLALARVQMFSLALFPLLALLLRAEARRPSARIWLAPLLIALWANLHGAALSGVAILYGYLLLSRARVDWRVAAGVALAGAVALCVTPAGIRSVDYYHGLLTNVAASRGVGLWAPLGHSPYDWVTVVCAVLLAVRFLRRRPPLWEVIVALGLAGLTVQAARNGVWLLLFMAVPASGVAAAGRRASARRQKAPRPGSHRLGAGASGAALAAVVMAGVALLAVDVAGAPKPVGPGATVVARAIRLAAGSPILADGLSAERVALEGGRVWAGNPLDAFSDRVQGEYLSWISGEDRGHAALDVPGVRVVLASAGSAAAKLTARDRSFREVADEQGGVVYVRRG